MKKTNSEIDKLAENALAALDKYSKLTQEEIDDIVHAMTLAGIEAHMELAKLAVEETGRGVVEDKAIKNIFATEYIWNSIKKEKSVGVIRINEADGYVEIAEPVGVVAGVTPVTNPTSTTLFKSLICAKTRNPIIFAFHPSSQKCSVRSAEILRDAAVKHGAPAHCIQWIETPSIEKTTELLHHSGISLILATGGSGMVKAAYSAGKPALGVGPGNVPCYINKEANLERACNDLILSKIFDNGMICASEQAVIVDKEISDKFEIIVQKLGCYFLKEDEIKAVSDYLIIGGGVNPEAVGKPAAVIAEKAGISVPDDTKILIAKLPEPSEKYPLSHEKLSPVLAYFISENEEQGLKYSRKMLELGGLGHSAVIHSENKRLCLRFSEEMMVGRVIVNSPSSQGAIGDIYNTNTPSLTLGCGSYGRNSTTSNVSSVNLINIKRVAERQVNMQWFKIPPKIYFERGSIEYLSDMPEITKALIVTDEIMVKLGYVKKIIYQLRKRNQYCHSEIFSDVEPDPDIETVMRGVSAANQFKPDVIIALGGGSVIDAAKAILLFYEHPDISFEGIKLKFLDIRKRAFRFPRLGSKAKLVAIPTTSGTGSEVTSFSVITDKKKGIKYPLADYELTPDVAIVDPQFTESMPQSVIADTGFDVLTHAIEAYVSVYANDYTDGLALKAIELVINYLFDSYSSPQNKLAREKMHNASCIAGLAFSNSFLGINHSLAHKLGGEFHIPHGRANAILLPYVIDFNSQIPTKFTAFPKYEYFNADKRYEEIARHLNLQGETTEDLISSLKNEILNLMKKTNMPRRISECGVDKDAYFNALPRLAEQAFEDQCTPANPRYPLIRELEELYRKAY